MCTNRGRTAVRESILRTPPRLTCVGTLVRGSLGSKPSRLGVRSRCSVATDPRCLLSVLTRGRVDFWRTMAASPPVASPPSARAASAGSARWQRGRAVWTRGSGVGASPAETGVSVVWTPPLGFSGRSNGVSVVLRVLSGRSNDV